MDWNYIMIQYLYFCGRARALIDSLCPLNIESAFTTYVWARKIIQIITIHSSLTEKPNNLKDWNWGMKEVFEIGERTGSSYDLKEQNFFYQFSRSLEKKKTITVKALSLVNTVGKMPKIWMQPPFSHLCLISKQMCQEKNFKSPPCTKGFYSGGVNCIC